MSDFWITVNYAEQIMRNLTTGCKNFMFSVSDEVAKNLFPQNLALTLRSFSYFSLVFSKEKRIIANEIILNV